MAPVLFYRPLRLPASIVAQSSMTPLIGVTIAPRIVGLPVGELDVIVIDPSDANDTSWSHPPDDAASKNGQKPASIAARTLVCSSDE